MDCSFVDTHTHLYMPEYDQDRDEVVRNALNAGVRRFILPNVDMASVPLMQAFAEKYPEVSSMAMALHPTEVGDDYKDVLDVLGRNLYDASDDYIAVGEAGMDLYWDKTHEREQRDAFEQQVKWASDTKKPLIIHCREGLDATLDVLGKYPDVRGVFHCFTGSDEDVKRIREAGDYYFGIGGVVTFKKSTLPAVLEGIPLERVLLETDSPYLAPTPHRGKRNDSSYIPLIAAKVAEVYGTSVEEIASRTSENSLRLFGVN